jgi:hypothetical protein
MKPFTRQLQHTRDSRYRRLTMGFICPSISDVLYLRSQVITGAVPGQWNHDQLSNEEAGMR